MVASSDVSRDSITFFGGQLSFQSSPLGGNVNYLSAQYLKNHLDELFSYFVVASLDVSRDSITFFGGQLSFQSSPLGGNVNYLFAQYLKNHLNYFSTLWLLLRMFLGIRLHFSVVSLVFKAHH